MQDARSRLIAAIVASAALHWALLYGVTVRAPEASYPPLIGRLQPEPPPLGQSPSQASSPSALPPTSRRMPSGHGAPLIRIEPTTPAPQATELPVPARLPVPPADSALPSVAMPLLSDPTWYTADQLDVYPRTLSAVRPAYPEQPAAQGIGGDVTLLVLVDERGSVEEASVVQAAPEGYFEAAALAAFRMVHFEPARKDGRSVRSRVLVRVSFDPAARDLPATSAAR